MDDPRRFPGTAPTAEAGRLHALAGHSLEAADGQQATRLDREIALALDAALKAGDGPALAHWLESAPSLPVYRHLWRALADRERNFSAGDEGLTATVFAVPLVLVAGIEKPGAADSLLLAGLSDPPELIAILREHRAIGGNENFALAAPVVKADAIEIARLPALLALGRIAADRPVPELAPAPVAVQAGSESVHLRFLFGTAVAAPGADLLGDTRVGTWGIPLARALARQLGAPGATLLVLPRAPQRLVPAVWAGRAAQREVSAQLFASNALRRFRSGSGEPAAVLSVHGLPGGRGEVRLSLSSPFDPREAEGFRCPVYPLDSVADVATMLLELMRACRVADVRTLAGVHPDRDAGTGLPLFFKPETIPSTAAVTLH